MNIDKLKNYNQKILALLGTILVLMAVVGLIMMIVAGISELKWMRKSRQENTGILSDERIEELQQEKKRQQVISYDIPRLVDTVNLIYVIPVRHQTLNSAEYIDEELLGIMDAKVSFKRDSRYSRKIYGSFNNILIYDLKNNTTTSLFDERINIDEIHTGYLEGECIILFSASSEDTFKDGVINLRDLKSLYLYSFTDKELRRIALSNMDVQYYEFVENRKDLLVRFGVDYDNDGQYNESYEPSVIKKYDYFDDKLIDVVDQETNIKLQKLLEGSKN